ncbi:MAG: hypothetical protein RL662_2410 [Bacteroidota bacterium]|jgi:hypothetical protein
MSLSKRIFSLMPSFAQAIYSSCKNKYQIAEWNKMGQPVPVPHAIKQEMINKYRNLYNTHTLVESGTYMGDMVWAQRNNFKKIYSIELSKDFVIQARKRFKNTPHIEIIQGDSGKIMATLIKELPERTLFWLDGHYSAGETARGDKDCPIWEELKAILSSNTDHVLLIDDARCFTGQRDYPTIEGLHSYITNIYPGTKLHIENDSIVVELRTKTDEDV